MWNDNEGGFNTPSQTQTPGGSGGEKRRQRAQNLVPMSIRDILDNHDETLAVEGLEVGMVAILGKVKTVKNETTKSTFEIEDNTGTIEVIQWADEGGEKSKESPTEEMTVRAIGAPRTSHDRKHIMAFKIQCVDNPEEIKGHRLDIQYSKLKIRQLKNKENSIINGGGGGGGLSNSMMGGATGNYGGTSTLGGMSSNQFENPKQEATMKLIAGCTREEGISRDELTSSLSSKMSRNDVDAALEFLSGEGHIYSTIDEDHFKTTDS